MGSVCLGAGTNQLTLKHAHLNHGFPASGCIEITGDFSIKVLDKGLSERVMEVVSAILSLLQVNLIKSS